MKAIETSLAGVWLLELDPKQDERGFLVRTYCEKTFASLGLNTRWPQCNLTLTKKKGMLRGMHFQADPHPEIKLVRCAAGAIYDVVLDVRPDSVTYGKWEGFELRAGDLKSLYIPGGFAHGFQCLEDDCQVFYQMSEFYHPDLTRGVRWNDPNSQIKWPIANPFVSQRDSDLPLLTS